MDDQRVQPRATSASLRTRLGYRDSAMVGIRRETEALASRARSAPAARSHTCCSALTGSTTSSPVTFAMAARSDCRAFAYAAARQPPHRSWPARPTATLPRHRRQPTPSEPAAPTTARREAEGAASTPAGKTIQPAETDDHRRHQQPLQHPNQLPPPPVLSKIKIGGRDGTVDAVGQRILR